MFKFSNKYALFAVVVGGLWLALLAGDWFMRFYWFKWHTVFLQSKQEQKQNQADTRCESNFVSAVWGGDLTKLIGIRSEIDKFAEKRPSYWDYKDMRGYRNHPESQRDAYDVVVCGDSYMQAGIPLTNIFNDRLGLLTSMSVYNHAIAGRGPIVSLNRFFDSEHFKTNPPVYLVWGIVERELQAHIFAGSLVWELWDNENPDDQKVKKVALMRKQGVAWYVFSPRNLRVSLPSHSVIAQLARTFWNKLRYVLFGHINPAVIKGKQGSDGWEPLFYGESVEALMLGDEKRDIERIVWSIEYLNDYCRRHHIKLLTILIPDKAQVYREYLPDATALPPSCLWNIEEGLKEKGVATINLLPAFRRAAAEGHKLYWRDDTHWNSDGISLAANATAELLLEMNGANISDHNSE